MIPRLLTRDEFRHQVFERDKHLCVVCKSHAKDAHHILERRLFPDSGYYIDNGASVCDNCHKKSEMTIISCDELRALAGIKQVIMPPHLYPDHQYTKWGDVILDNGMRLRGELFFDESVQKVLKEGLVLSLYTHYVKYPRTYHLPWSPGANSDDRILDDLNNFKNKEVIVTLKMDGENTTMYSDYIHSRSLTENSHPSRNWVKSFHSQIKHNIPEGWRVCGENLFAKHSIEYSNLESFFLCFSIWNEKNICLSWDETVEWASLLGIQMVQPIYRGMFDEKKIKKLFQPNLN
jgi:hypothetical protein